MSKSPDTAIIILNWNGWQHTLQCIESLEFLLKQGLASVWICDNGSDDDSWLQLQQAFGKKNQIHLLQTGKNLGFAAGMNHGIRAALLDPTIVYVWLLNNDTWLETDALSPLKACAKAQPQIGLWGSQMYNAKGELQSASGYRYNPWLTTIKALKKPTQRPSYIDGAALFIPRHSLETIGLLTEDYFLFYEELDYSQRLHQMGYQLACCSDSHVFHQGSASLGGDAIAKRLQRQYYENRNTLLFSVRFYPYRLWFILPWRLLVKLLLLGWRGEWDLYPALLRAYKDFFWRK